MISKKDEKILRKMLSMATEPDEALTYDEMRGFLFGVAITPDVIRPSEWLPMVFGEELITIDSEEEGNRLLNSLLHIFNGLMERFHKKTLRFPFGRNYLANQDDIVTVQEWAYGLNEALSLRPDCWLVFLPELIPEGIEEEYDEELMNALSVIHGIADPDIADELFDTEFEEAEDRSMRLIASLYLILPTAVDTILEHAELLEMERQERFRNRPAFPSTIRHELPKIGRNDPCPCGSGKKYKKCCMRKEKVVPIR